MSKLTHAALGAAVLLCAVAPAAEAKDKYDAETVLVEYAPGITAEQKRGLHERSEVKGDRQQIYGDEAWVAEVKEGKDPAKVAAKLARSGLVEYAEPNFVLRATATPNDPDFPSMYGLSKIQAPAGWDAAGLAAFPGTGGVRVGIVDTGIDRSHPELSGKIVGCAQSRGFLVFAGSIQNGSCTDDNGHGTHVAGTIAAATNNARQVAGVAFNSTLVICRALGGALGTGNTSDVANCINWAYDQGAKVISMSLGGGDSTTLRNAIVRVWNSGNGALPVAAAGNDGDSTVNYPAGYAQAVSVAATDADDQRASFSNANSDVEIAAPGVDILSTWLSGGTNTISGTSMATPHVAGVAALITWRFGTTAAATRSRLTAAVDDLGAAGRDSAFGFGRTNLLKAMAP